MTPSFRECGHLIFRWNSKVIERFTVALKGFKQMTFRDVI
jgi:hypothetical protein